MKMVHISPLAIAPVMMNRFITSPKAMGQLTENWNLYNYESK
jgi:hypothetical protein